MRRLDLHERGSTISRRSGGADSVSLLLAARTCRREKADTGLLSPILITACAGVKASRTRNCPRSAVKYGFELAVGHGKVEREGNLEQNARTARYSSAPTAENLHAAGVLTGHTMNDQAETFLINLIRGSGPEGLGGMKSVRGLKSKVQSPKSEDQSSKIQDQTSLFKDDILLIRPLLTWAKRSDTENYCHEMGVEYRYDTMNEDLGFRRVRIRKVLIPMLEDFNPKIIETLAQTASLMRDGGGSSGEAAAEPADKLALKDLKTLEKADLYRTLRAWLEQHRGNLRGLELKHIEAIENLINSRKSGKTVELPGGDTIVKENGMLNFAAKG